MEKTQFEEAIWDAINAPSKSGTKWKPLERLFSEEGKRGGGALNNDPAERRTRIRQLLTTRKHPGFDTDEYSRHCVFVLNASASTWHSKTPSVLDSYVVKELINERPSLPPSEVMESAIVLKIENNEIIPLKLLKWGPSEVGDRYTVWYPNIEVLELTPPNIGIRRESAIDSEEGQEDLVIGRNLIYFGPPGTGKSYLIDSLLTGAEAFIRCVFHPDYSYSDFVGTYKPVVGMDSGRTIQGYDGEQISCPVIYYAFEPGHFAQAVVLAKKYEPKSVILIIEEINRGDCAAIFGDCFQLLDRSTTGGSEYGIRPTYAFGKYLCDSGIIETPTSDFFLPSNLTIAATMNTADQSLFHMDSAFKRRWEWKAVTVDYDNPTIATAKIPATDFEKEVQWVDLINRVNDAIIAAELSGDKRIGTWYIKPIAGIIERGAIRDKLLFYLWHDVFRDREHLVFNEAITTYDNARLLFDTNGLRFVLSPLLNSDM